MQDISHFNKKLVKAKQSTNKATENAMLKKLYLKFGGIIVI